MKKIVILSAVVAAFWLSSCSAKAKQQAPENDSVEQARQQANDMPLDMPGEKVYEDSMVVFHQVENHLWIGHGHAMAMETLYLVEGDKSAVLIDCGTKIDHLDDIVAKLTSKPVTLIATHVHPDHVGAVDWFPEIWINPADTVNIQMCMPQYKGKINYIQNGQKFDLGGRVLEAFFTPGHTPGSTTFVDKEHHYAFSGDSFGNGNLLLTTDFSTMIKTCEATAKMMEDNKIDFFYNGHYFGNNPETLQRVKDLITISKEIMSGTVKGEDNPQGMVGLNKVVNKFGVRVNYSDAQLK